MRDKAKRPWFRFHLFTAVLLILCAGVWLGANCIERTSAILDDRILPLRPCDPDEWKRVQSVDILIGTGCGKWFGYPFLAVLSELKDPKVSVPYWHGRGIAANLSIAAITLLIAAFISESVIRRRERRNP